LAASQLAAQGVRTELLPPLGTEVRARFATGDDSSTTEGTLIEASQDGIVLEQDQGRHLYRIPTEVLVGLERSLGRDHPQGALQGLGLGILGGALALGGLAAISAEDDPSCIYFCSRGSNFLVGAVVGGAIGGGIGLVVGAAVGTARWQRLW
jgi:hypothetical protein